ncbi:type IX secretion system ring subunit PorN/GldN [Algoriphagus hitonicola]|uniref:Gliding motility associated protien GldN n=1 Tax=Algoriphagus hitonicola TaxID=435880 RepID=A0A1I2VYY0_9BACT|nr:gliding motility protein GldN [Algoriphagus hitonicola]SFG94293.1 gliding motility associated protien GldN [Algoriphagus hitonicola]
MKTILQKLILAALVIGLFAPLTSNAQVATSVNPSGFGDRQFDMDTIFSARKIREDDKMYQIGVWRRIDLREKYNLSLYGSGDAKSNGIINQIYDAIVDENALEVFGDEDFTQPLSIAEFQENFWLNATGDSIFSKQLYYLDFKEDFVFDKHHSDMVFDIKFIHLVMPSATNSNAGEKTIGYIRYKDFFNYFKDHPEARWINFKNLSKSLTYDEAFESRLFRSVVRRYTNPDEALVADLVDLDHPNPEMQAYLDALAFEYDLLEFENSLWEW